MNLGLSPLTLTLLIFAMMLVLMAIRTPIAVLEAYLEALEDGVKTLDAEALDFATDQRVLVGLRLIQRRLMMIQQHEHAILVPHAWQAVLETRLLRHLHHGLGRMVVTHRAVDARLQKIACPDLAIGEIVPRQQLLGHG